MKFSLWPIFIEQWNSRSVDNRISIAVYFRFSIVHLFFSGA